MKVVLVTGSRKWPDDGSVERELDLENPDMLILGDCPTGADAIAQKWAKGRWPGASFNHHVRIHRADWDHWRRVGRPGWAGPVRNYAMAMDLSQCVDRANDCVALAFDMGGRGTASCIAHVRAVGVTLRIVKGV